MNPYLIYVKLGAAALLLAIVGGVCWHMGGLGPTAALASFQAEQSQLTAKAVLAERASAAATVAQDHTTEEQHAKVIVSIDSAPPVRTPVFLCGPGPLRVGTVPGAEAKADSGAPDPAEGRGERVGGERDIRPGVEALKRQLEKVMADYRQLDAEWPSSK